ncbi:hypothetical protein DOY81_006849 [Sarcophaga bullata]|nr:hypothetical protein DOY81_006849 [Sarcophaga bullata]
MDAEENKKKCIIKLEKRSNCLVIPVHSVIIFLLATLATAILVDLLPTRCSYYNWFPQYDEKNNQTATGFAAPNYAIYGKSKTEEHLIHVVTVLKRLGYHRVRLEDNWNLLWAHDYPFINMPLRMKNLDKNQIVNHFPGCGFLTNKVDLSTTALPFLPKAFRLPSQREEFLDYIEHHPHALFVEKHNEHRHIAIRAPEEINLYSNNSFIQEFIQNPFLVDGHKFDIGVYVVITSIDPLRLYIYSGDVLFRYCPVEYYPFNASNIDKYVVGDDYLPTWQVPSLVKFYNSLGGSMRGAFDAYVRDQNLDPSIIWQQVDDIIRSTVLEKEQDISRILRSYKMRNFFDLIRFDLIIDDKLKVHLMEANMSPNLSYDEVTEMITSEKNLATNLNKCSAHDCDKFCNRQECDLCLPCLSGSEYEILEKTHREHLHRISMKRIFPKPILQPENFDIATEVQNMTKRNAWLTRWFYYKCVHDSTWCN